MPDTWTILKSQSSLNFGDAWQHLNSKIVERIGLQGGREIIEIEVPRQVIKITARLVIKKKKKKKIIVSVISLN